MRGYIHSLQNNEPLVREMLKAYWANYRIKPDEAELNESLSWGMSLEKDALEYALNIDNHGDFPQNRNPRLFDLKGLANGYREARGNFYHAPLPDTSPPKEPECLYCAGGNVYNIIFKGERWSVERIGICAVCSGGKARTSPIFIEMAEYYNINVGEVMHHFTLFLLKYKFKCGLLEIHNADIKKALVTFGQYCGDKLSPK